MGEDRVMLGSDSPFPLGEQTVGALVRESGLADTAKANCSAPTRRGFFDLAAAAR